MKYYIETFGCQMNTAESVQISHFFEKNGHSPVLNINEANLIIVNMCSVRQSAVDRVFGVIEKIKGLKNQKTNKPIAILTGCILKKDRQKFEKLFDYVLDIKNLPSWLKILKIKLALKIDDRRFSQLIYKSSASTNISANVPITSGCNNFCSYCVVPYVRGSEKSRPAKEIICEIKNLVRNGTKEIWLLGQNVNSYKDKNVDFPKLLKMVNSIKGDFWIRFTSSHPKDFSQNLIKAMARLKKVTPYLNLPAQSGDDEILKAMNRHYKIKDYIKIIKEVRKKMPDISLSTDIIVGFPNESKKQFENTKKLLEIVKYDMAYINKYSPRTGTRASKLKDNVPIKEKKEREQILTQILKKTALEKNKRFINKTTKVLAESDNGDTLVGKTWHYKTIKFKGPKKLVGKFARVKIINATPWGLKGILV